MTGNVELLLWIIVGGGIGALIGSSKNRRSEGMCLGLLLGPLGWIIELCLPRIEVARCPHCHGGTDGLAAVCCHCGRDIPQIFPPDRWNRRGAKPEPVGYNKPDPAWLALAVAQEKAAQPPPQEPESELARCPCNTCSVNIEFPAHAAGQTVTCPKCGLPTVLFDAANKIMLLLALAALVALTARAETFTFKSGIKFEGDLLRAEGTNAIIVRSARDGLIYTLMLSNLTDLDQSMVRFATGQAVLPTTHEEYKATLRAERDRTEAAKTLPESPPDKPGEAGQITGAFGLKLCQTFDLRYATRTNESPVYLTIKGIYTRVDMTEYSFRPRTPLMHFDWYAVGVTPRSNIIYSIHTMANDFESRSSAYEDSEKLVAALEQKYGKTNVKRYDHDVCYDFRRDGRNVQLVLSCPTNSTPFLMLSYTDTALDKQAEYEQAAIDAADPKRKAERDKLKDQL